MLLAGSVIKFHACIQWSEVNLFQWYLVCLLCHLYTNNTPLSNMKSVY